MGSYHINIYDSQTCVIIRNITRNVDFIVVINQQYQMFRQAAEYSVTDDGTQLCGAARMVGTFRQRQLDFRK